jgi:outer membrane protein assembly factor BamB
VANSQRVATIQGASMVGSPLAVTGDGKLLVTSDDGDNLKLYTITPAQPAAAAPAPRRRR